MAKLSVFSNASVFFFAAKIITVKDGTVLSTDATATVASLGEFVQFSQQR